ncbi:MAG: TetR/AcrR family transcriptional regulator [Rhizobiaceae bacterium]
MPTASRRYHHGDLRAALLSAGEAELAARGVEGFTLRGVAKRAGVSHAAPAHHFRDTAALLTALATQAARELTASMLERQGTAARDPRSQLVAAGLGYVDFALAKPALFKLLFGSERPDAGDPEMVHHATASFDVLLTAVGAVRQAGPHGLDDDSLDVAAAWSIVHGVATLLLAGRLKFLGPRLEADREGTLRRMIERAVP